MGNEMTKAVTREADYYSDRKRGRHQPCHKGESWKWNIFQTLWSSPCRGSARWSLHTHNPREHSIIIHEQYYIIHHCHHYHPYAEPRLSTEHTQMYLHWSRGPTLCRDTVCPEWTDRDLKRRGQTGTALPLWQIFEPCKDAACSAWCFRHWLKCSNYCACQGDQMRDAWHLFSSSKIICSHMQQDL